MILNECNAGWVYRVEAKRLTGQLEYGSKNGFGPDRDDPKQWKEQECVRTSEVD